MKEGPFTGQPQAITPGWKNGSEFIVKNLWACELSLDQVIQHAKCFTDDRKGLATATLTSPLKTASTAILAPQRNSKQEKHIASHTLIELPNWDNDANEHY